MILGEIPQHGVDLAANPGNVITAHVCSNQHAIIINRVIFILQGLIVPDTGIENDLFTVLHFIINSTVFIHRAGHAHLLRGIYHKVVIVQI